MGVMRGAEVRCWCPALDRALHPALRARPRHHPPNACAPGSAGGARRSNASARNGARRAARGGALSVAVAPAVEQCARGYKELCAYFDSQAAGFHHLIAREGARLRREEDELLQCLGESRSTRASSPSRSGRGASCSRTPRLSLDIEAGARPRQRARRACVRRPWYGPGGVKLGRGSRGTSARLTTRT